MDEKKREPQSRTDVERSDDPSRHKGFVEGLEPGDNLPGNPLGDGIDADGLPNDPTATAQDRIGANEDETQG